MAEYIERKALINVIKERNGRVPEWVKECVLDCTLEDVRPERHGRWIPDEDCVACSECGTAHWGHYRASYCEDCGAKMDREFDDWISVSEQLPPENQIVDTKIDDEKGVRNVTQLRFYKNLWFFPDKSVYVYYSPTHWKYITKRDGDSND